MFTPVNLWRRRDTRVTGRPWRICLPRWTCEGVSIYLSVYIRYTQLKWIKTPALCIIMHKNASIMHIYAYCIYAVYTLEWMETPAVCTAMHTAYTQSNEWKRRRYAYRIYTLKWMETPALCIIMHTHSNEWKRRRYAWLCIPHIHTQMNKNAGGMQSNE